MTLEALGNVSGSLPAPTGSSDGLVFEVLFAPDPNASTRVYVWQNSKPIFFFNPQDATGPIEQPFLLGGLNEGGPLDPRQFSVGTSNGNDGMLVSYLVS